MIQEKSFNENFGLLYADMEQILNKNGFSILNSPENINQKVIF
jgi:hypothetical protein